MKYQVWISNLQYGVAYVEAKSPEEAKEKARRQVDQRRIEWHEEEITDLNVEEDV